MKVTTNDLLAILRRFNIASDINVPREIDQVKQSHPSPINQLVRLRFMRGHYFVLFDETAQDNYGYIMEQIYTADSNIDGTLLENPMSELSTYGLPFKGKDVYVFKAVSGKKRLDILLAERHPDISRSTWQKHIKAGNVAVNGAPAKSAKQEVTEADRIAVTIPEDTDYSAHDLPIIYLDDDVIVINKPVGVLTHSKGALNDEFTVADFFKRYTTVGLDTNRPGIVHRLDRDTSGIMIGARTPESFASLKKQFANRNVKKTYVAITQGIPNEQKATIEVPIGRNPTKPSTFRPDPKGKPAVTDYEVVKTHNCLAYVTLRPKTGRTHQLRVHMAYLHTPIAGDRMYGTPDTRLFLHAQKLEVTIANGQRKTFTSAVPAEFIAKIAGE